MPIIKPIRLQSRKLRSRKSDSGIIGSPRQPLFVDKPGDPRQAEGQNAPQLRVAPLADRPALGGKQNDAQQRHAEVNRPKVINLMLAAPRTAVENRANDKQGKQPQRQVDVENPAPMRAER